jgi:arylsulfatase A-like enzyme
MRSTLRFIVPSLAWIVPFSTMAAKPNIVLILADDLGYGDVQINNPERGKIPTPHMDRIAEEGMRFTDAHSSSAVCSPSRYTLLTGRYHWRTRLQNGIVGVFGPPLIAAERRTVAGLLKGHGYRTAAIGKWHLGWDWPIPKGEMARFGPNQQHQHRPADPKTVALWAEVFSKPIANGPTTRGFDTYFGTDVPNWPPFCFIENDRTVGIPSEWLPASLLTKNLASRPGPALPGWKLEPILPALGERAVGFIRESARKKQPFFLYLPLTSPHTPISVNDEWKGRSGLGPYADFVMETDALVGRILAALDQSGAANETLVVLTSDNGCSPLADIPALQAKGHFPSGPLRGTKFDAWEGGHRVPFFVRWPGVVKPGGVSSQLVHHADLMATVTEILGDESNPAEDSFSLLPLLRGTDSPVREHAISQSANGLSALRQGPWKLIFGPGSGGQSKGGDAMKAQLYHLGEDLAESRNLHDEKPEVVTRMTDLMEKLVRNGRSTPGEPRKNDVEVNWRKFMK